MRPGKLRWLLPALFAALAGCTLLPAPPLPAPTAVDDPDRQWQVRGKLGVRTPDGRDSLHFHWQYAHPAYTLRLSAPIGGQQAVIHSTGQTVTLSLPDGSHRQANSAEALIAALYGWQVPVTSLRWWVHGLPDPERNGQTSTSDDGQQRRLQQDGWQVRWSHYRDFQSTRLPGRIEVSAPDATTAFTLLIQDWQWP